MMRTTESRLANTILPATALVVALLATPGVAQFVDLQPGRNYPNAVPQFGADVTESIDFGDVDNDGDLDVVTGNGGDSGPRANRIFINRGGLQGFSEGTFADETSLRFAGMPDDTTRDMDFGDIDGDGDLDLVVANRGTTANGGEPNRFYVNQGGLQGGTVGFFAEGTDTAWGTLVSVPAEQQVLGGDQGPWRNYSCDCDFADIDDDGDLDLFNSAYGPNVNGTRDSRLFLNDGGGIFHELWPWADAAADIRLHTFDVEPVDLDGDFDLDLFGSSRDSQARVYLNQLYAPLPSATEPFEDVTLESLINTGSVASGNSSYGCEYGDVDEDGDFDLWMLNYTTFTEKLLVNTGPGAPGIVAFAESDGPGPDLIKGDPNADENEIDFLDFDNDGDLDAFSANFSGTNWIWANGTAQGLTGEYHRTGTFSAGSLYLGSETPNVDNSGTTRDADTGDLDGDGDTDVALGNDSNQLNRVWFNVLGVPDTHAPVFQRVTDAADLPLAGDVVLHAQVRDNASFQMIAFYDAEVVWTADGGPEQRAPMISQGGQQFRGEVSLGAFPVSEWSFRFEVTDRAGNTGLSIGQGVGGSWTSLGAGLAGVSGIPALGGTGPLQPLTAGTVELTGAITFSPLVFFFGTEAVPQPFKGGLLLPSPVMQLPTLITDHAGAFSLPFIVPASVPSPFQFTVQAAIMDGAAVSGVSLSNALMGQ